MTAYGVLSRGLLSGSTPAAPGDFRAYLPRFTGENRERNQRLVEALQRLAAEKGISAVAVRDRVGAGERPRHRSGDRRAHTDAARGIAGRARRRASPAEVARIEEAVPASAVAGTRYDEHQMRALDSER